MKCFHTSIPRLLRGQSFFTLLLIGSLDYQSWFDWSKICLDFQALNSNILFWLTLSKAQISPLNSRRCSHTSKRPFSAAKCSAVFFSCGNRQIKIIKTKVSKKMTRGKSKKIRVLRAGVELVTFRSGFSITGTILGSHVTSWRPCWCTEQQRKKSWEFDSIIMQNLSDILPSVVLYSNMAVPSR